MSDVLNKRMEEKLRKLECMDVRVIGRTTDDPDVFVLSSYVSGVDYADAQTERWIWSIGEEKGTGVIRASTDGRYYQNPKYECLWLR